MTASHPATPTGITNGPGPAASFDDYEEPLRPRRSSGWRGSWVRSSSSGARSSGRRRTVRWSVTSTVKLIHSSLSGRWSSAGPRRAAAAAAAASRGPGQSILRSGSFKSRGDNIEEMLRDGEADLAEIIRTADEESILRTDEAREAAVAYRTVYGTAGSSSAVVVTNRTAARLKLVRHDDSVGRVYGRCTYPQTIGPGRNGSFLHVSPVEGWTHGSRGSLTYAVHVYDGRPEPADGEGGSGTGEPGKGDAAGGGRGWVDSRVTMTFRWDTGPRTGNKAPRNSASFLRHPSGDVKCAERPIVGTGTRYDGTKICGGSHVGERSKLPVYTFAFTQWELGEDEAQGAAERARNADRHASCCVIL